MAGRPKVLIDDTGRVCQRCHEYKLWDQFPPRSNRSNCRRCLAARKRQFYHERGGSRYFLDQHYRCAYGLSIEQARELQSKPCGACGTVDRQRVVDHCHQTGAVRGPLCNPCNQALGLLRDDPERIRGLLAYLAR